MLTTITVLTIFGSITIATSHVTPPMESSQGTNQEQPGSGNCPTFNPVYVAAGLPAGPPGPQGPQGRFAKSSFIPTALRCDE